MPNNAKKSVYKEKEFDMYVLWKSLPAYFRGMKEKELHTHGFTDPLIMKITAIKSQTAFAKKFRIKDLGTLTDWNAKIKEHKLDSKASQTAFQKQAQTVNATLSTLPDTLLKKKLFEQRKLVSQLKRENELLKNQLKKRPVRRIEKNAVPAVIPTTPPPTEISMLTRVTPTTTEPIQSAPTNSTLIPPAQPEKKTFLQKALLFFQRKK
jgi:hypothetical protein